MGLVGIGPESTIPYYRDTVYGVKEMTDDGSFPILAIENVNLFDVLRLCKEKQYGELTQYLLKAIKTISSGLPKAIVFSFNPILKALLFLQI